MISVEMEDVLAVLQLCKPYIIGIIAALVIGIVIMTACRRMSRDKRFLIRREAAIAMVLAVVVCVNMICFGPMATLIGLATGNGTLSDETNEEAAEVAEEIMEDGIVLLKNESLLPLNETKKLNIFGWESINPAYGGAGSGGINDLYDIVSLNQGLENAGFSINQKLVDFYNNYGADNPEMSIQKQSWTLPEPPVDTYSDEHIKSAKEYSDVAVVVLSRKAGEGHNDIPMDVKKAAYDNNSDEYDTGLIKRETSKALHAVINFVVVFVLSASFIAYAPDYIKKINEFSSDISTASLDLGTKIMLPNSDSEGKDSVDLIRDSLFSIQVEQPWLLLQFGNSNAEEIGTDRVEALVSASPEDEDGKTREEVVKTEIEDNDNNNLTIPQVVNRLGMVFFLLFFNLGITIFVFLLTGMMLFSQILFIIFAMFLPISFLLSMIPSYESMAKQAIVRVFNTIMTRAGITLIVTVAFSISSMFYNISTDYPFFMVAFLQIVCFAGIYMKLGDLMSMFSLNANDSQSMGRRIFRRPYLFMRHRARRMEHRIARAVSAGGISGGVAGAVAGSAVAGKRAERKNTASKENRGNTTSSMGQRAGSKVGAVLDTKNKVKDKANAVKENIKDMPTQTAYAVYSAKEKAKSSVSDFKRGMVQEQKSRQTGRLEKQEQHRQNIADKRMELQKAQEARQAQRKADGSATTGATRPHERPATASTIPKPSTEKTQEIKRPATATTSKASEPVKTNIVKERPLSSGASDRKATQPTQPVHRQNVEKVVSQETHQNYKAERTTKAQTFEQSKRTTEHTEKNRNLVTKKGQKKK